MSVSPDLTRLLPKSFLQPVVAVRTEEDQAGLSSLATHDADECRTPTSEDSKLPIPWSCPLAPRKPKRVVACKRRRSELEFFRIGAEEMELLFPWKLQTLETKKRKSSAEEREG